MDTAINPIDKSKHVFIFINRDYLRETDRIH